MTTIETVIFIDYQLPVLEEEGIFGKIQSLKNVVKVAIKFRGHSVYDEGTARTLSRYIQNPSSPSALGLWYPLPQSGAQFIFLCDAIGRSSLKRLWLIGARVDEAYAEWATEFLAHAIVNCSSLTEFSLVLETNLGGRWTMDNIYNALCHATAVRTFDLSFRQSGESIPVLELSRPTPWKPLLSDDHIPLSYRPHILAKAAQWDQETSHGPLDALLFLTREKSDVLLQNVRKRKIRKRKRFQISS